MLPRIFIRSSLRARASPSTRARARGGSGWLGGLLKQVKGSPVAEEAVEDSTTPDAELGDVHSLETIALEHLPNCSKSLWKESGLGNTDSKAKILSSFESTFNCSIPNQDLASISTFTDLLQILEDISQQEEAPKLFPNIQNDETLPPNLSIQFINTAPKIKPNRRPFQNYDARRPEHALFLTKVQKEKRKKKRRHLTALK